MVSNDDFDGKATHLNCFYLHINIEQKYQKSAIVYFLIPFQASILRKLITIGINCFFNNHLTPLFPQDFNGKYKDDIACNYVKNSNL